MGIAKESGGIYDQSSPCLEKVTLTMNSTTLFSVLFTLKLVNSEYFIKSLATRKN